MKVVVMGNGGYLRFRDQFGQGNSQRNMHRYTQGVLGDQQVDIEGLDEVLQLNLDNGFQGMNGFGDAGFASLAPEDPLVDPSVLIEFEMGFRNQKTSIRFPVEFSGKPEAPMPFLFQDLGPFAGFQSHTVRAGKPR
jgi:hypothetical protein